MSETAASPAAAVVSLAPHDVPRVHAIYLASLAALPDPSAVRRDEPAFFDWIFASGGEILGLSIDGALVAYGCLRPEVALEHDRVGLSGRVPDGATIRVLDGSAVLPAFWKAGLGRQVIVARIDRAGELGTEHVVAKASPGNVPSMRNLTRCGFRVVGRVMKPYGWRYVHHRAVRWAEPEPEGGEWLPSADVDGAEALFRAGRFAFAARCDEAGRALLKFAPPQG